MYPEGVTSESERGGAAIAGRRIEQAFALCPFASQRGGAGNSVTSCDPARIFETLDCHGVDYLTIGGGAVIAYGYLRATADIDFVARLDEDNMARLAAGGVSSEE